jgi:hypothetical protein
MKYITLIIGLLVMGCGKQEQTDANESTPTTNTNEVSGTTEKPVKELTKEDVVGTYEAKKDGRTEGVIFLENGVIESYENGKKRELEAKWTIINGEIHGEVEGGRILVFSINKDKSVTNIAVIDKDGEREDFPKEEAEQATMKKIK